MPSPPPTVLTGCDLQPVDEVDHAARSFGVRYLERIYTEAELERYRERGAGSLAARFAAKEAVLKMLGRPEGVDLRSVEVLAEDGERPRISLHGAAATLAESMGLGRIDVSLSHAGGLAMAVVVALVDPGAATRAVPASAPAPAP